MFNRPAAALVAILMLLGTLGACQRQSSTAPLVGGVQGIDDDALCLGLGAAELAAESPLHRAIDAARRQPDAARQWIAVGRGWLERVHARSDSGELLEAEACARAAQVRQPDSVDALELQASAKLNAHDFHGALALAETALKQSPEHVNLWGIKSDALLELGDYSAAAAAAQRQMQLWPGASAQARAAYFQWLHGDVEAAKRTLIVALRGRDEATPVFNAWLWQEVARLYWAEGDAAGADQFYARSLEELPGYAPALLGRARAALAAGEPDAARSYAQQALIAGAGINAAVVLGDAFAALGDHNAAELAYLQAEALGRRSDTLGLARFLTERRGDAARALKLLQPLRDKRGGLDLGDTLAWAQFRSGLCTDAAQTLRPVLALGVRDARLWLHGGAIELRCGDAERGRQLIVAAQQLDPWADPIALREFGAAVGLAGAPGP